MLHSSLNMTEKFSIQWNDFQSNVKLAFSQFRSRTHFQDVTLVSDDHQQITAHRVVLSAFSGYFNDVLSQTTHSHPLLCLDGINSTELNNVLDYIYNGELRIYPDNLDSFLKVAQKLKLEGLQNSKENNQSTFETFEISGKKDLVLPKKSSTNVSKKEKTYREDIVTLCSDDFQSIEELDSYIESQIESTEKGHKCIKCSKIFRHKAHIKGHIETHINGLSFSCDFCEKIMFSRTSVRDHKLMSKCFLGNTR